MVQIGQLVEGELAIALRRADEPCFRPTVCGKLLEFFQSPVSGRAQITTANATPAGELLDAGVNHATPEPVLKPLVKIADLP